MYFLPDMPAKTMIFDQRVRTLHDFGSAPHNTISFNAQGRLLFLAGFGNLAGKIDVFDRRTLNKICTIDAPNTSYCSWSPDGRFLLTATLSPRLRVDNGIKVWHASGPLVHVQAVDELYQASWRPTPIDQTPPFGQTIPPAPQPSASVLAAALTSKPVVAKPAGAYRPPGARGLATPAIFKREDEGGAPRVPGSATPPRGYNRSSNPPGSMPINGVAQNGHGQGGRKHVPGAAPRTPPPGVEGQGQGGQGQDKKRKKKEKKKAERAEGSGTVTPNGGGSARPSLDIQTNGLHGATNGVKEGQETEPATASVPPTPGVDQLDPIAKKVRNLNKKVSIVLFPLSIWL